MYHYFLALRARGYRVTEIVDKWKYEKVVLTTWRCDKDDCGASYVMQIGKL